MPMSTALRRCPSLVRISLRFSQYGEVSRQVMDIFRSVTPLIEPLSLDEAYLDISDLVELEVANVEGQAGLLKDRVREATGLAVTIGGGTSKTVAKISKVREGFEADIYTLEEAKRRISILQDVVTRAEKELLRLQATAQSPALQSANLRVIVEGLSALRSRNLDEATFDEKLEVVSNMGIKVYPSEDLKSMKVHCELNLDPPDSKPKGGSPVSPHNQGHGGSELKCGIVPYAPPYRIRTCFLRRFVGPAVASPGSVAVVHGQGLGHATH